MLAAALCGLEYELAKCHAQSALHQGCFQTIIHRSADNPSGEHVPCARQEKKSFFSADLADVG
jgi:hypothetical protein